MKKFALALLATNIIATAILAQKEEMKELWSVKLTHDADNTGLEESSGTLFSSNEKDMTVISPESGKVKWTNHFKDMGVKLRKVDEQIPMYEAKVHFLFERKLGKDQMVVIDLETGKLLWNTDKYQNIGYENVVYIPEMESFAISTKEALTMVKARTGEEVWSTTKFKGVVGAYLYDENEKAIIMLNYKPTAIAALFAGFKNQLVKINMSNGDIIWDVAYRGLVEKAVVSRKPLLKLWLSGDRLFLGLNGLHVYDYKTGKSQWSVAYDQSALDTYRRGFNGFGLGGKKLIAYSVYEAIADPIFDGNDVYIFDMASKNSQYVKKYDLISGKLLWTSPEIKKCAIAPNMYKLNNQIILQIGGVARVEAVYQITEKGANGAIYTYNQYKIFYQNFGPYGVTSFSADNGQQIWRSERFSKGVTNVFPHEDKLIVCSGKAIYSLDQKTGAEKYEVSLKDDNINNAYKIFDRGGDNVMILAEKGVSLHKKSDGSKVWAVRTKRGDFDGFYGNTAIYATEKDDQFAIDTETGKFTYYDARKGAKTQITNDGEYLFVFEKKYVTKLSTK